MVKKVLPWIVAVQKRRIRKTLGRLSESEAVNLQMLNITAEQIRKSPEIQMYPKFGMSLGKAAQKFKKRGLISYSKLFYSKKHNGYAIVGLQITEKGMKALSKAGGTVFLSPPKERK